MKRILKLSFCIVCCICTMASLAVAQNKTLSQPDDNRRKLFLSIEEAIQLVLQNNLEISVQQYNPQIKKEDITDAESAFDMTVSSSGSQLFADPASDSTPDGVTSLEASIGKSFTTGGTYEVSLNTELLIFGDVEATTTDSDGNAVRTTVSVDNQYATGLDLTVSQALLKNRGRAANTTQIAVARKNYDMSVSELRAKVVELISDVKTIYWNLVFALGDLEAKRLALRLAYDLVKINEAQVNVGTLAPIEVLQAKTTAAAREVDIINAEQTVSDIEDQLKRLLNIPDREYSVWNAALIPTDVPLESSQQISLAESIRSALEHREELVQTRTGIEIQEILLNSSENTLSPELNAIGQVSVNGSDDNLGGSLGNFFGFDSYSFTAGLNFSYPLGNRSAQSDFNQTKLELDQSKLSLQNLEQLIMVQVRQAVRNVRTSFELLDATRIALQLAQEQLDAEEKKFKEGLSTNFQVLNYQEELASAKSQHTRALTSYNQALVALDQITGDTLQRHNIVIDE